MNKVLYMLLIFLASSCWANALIAPRSLLSFREEGEENLYSILRSEFSSDIQHRGHLGVVIYSDTNDWAAISLIKSGTGKPARCVLLCKGMQYGDPSAELVRREVAIDSLLQNKLFNFFLHYVSAAENSPAKVTHLGYSQVEYWVSVGGGEIVSGISLSPNDTPLKLRKMLYVLVNYAKCDDSDRAEWGAELELLLECKTRPSRINNKGRRIR